MLSVLRSVSPSPGSAHSPSPKAKFRTVLGFSAVHKDLPTPSPTAKASRIQDDQLAPALKRRSVDLSTTPTGTVRSSKHPRGRSSVTDTVFFDPHFADLHSNPNSNSEIPTASTSEHEMKSPMTHSPAAARRIPYRLDGQDGPWTVSVAETPHDPSSYSLYVKTPTHNLTLTRTALEILELNGKLRDSNPSVRLPTLPIHANMIPHPPKRKSAFLNTLSRLASPSSKSARHTPTPSLTSPISPSSASSSVTSSARPTPSVEIGDPFDSDADSDMDVPTTTQLSNSTITGLAAYLTAIANEPTLRQTRVWRRFVRVRTDDLQSVRVERAIKRVRSDLAAHVSPGSTTEVHRSISQVVMNGAAAGKTAEKKGEAPEAGGAPEEDHREAVQDDIKEEDEAAKESLAADAALAAAVADGIEGETDRAPTPKSPKSFASAPEEPMQNGEDVEGAEKETTAVPTEPETDSAAKEAEDEAEGPSTPMASDVHPQGTAHRIPRSQSADPTNRASRIFTSAITPREPVSSEASATGGEDDSSMSTTGRRVARKKRSKSSDPNAADKEKRKGKKVQIDDFEMMRVLGKGCAGKVLLVRHKPTKDVFALKAITKRHVLAHQELQHTLTEQAVLKRMAAEGSDPFVVKLWWSFHDKENLFLVMDFHPGGDLATQLARWGRLGRDRARFYAAEIVEGVEGLHAAGVIYRDLKPENILIGGDGHIVLTDFGLSKEFPRRNSPVTAPPTPSGFRGDFTAGTPTAAIPHWMNGENGEITSWSPAGAMDTTTTFCGTAEYLAPEVIQGLPYSYEVDWWSFGTMLYEMLTGITPFWASNHSDMYYKVLQDELQFPEDRTMDQDTKSLVRGLLQRNPALRMKEPRIKKHPYFSMIDWSHVYYKRYIPPYIPPIDPSNTTDTQNFDDAFLDMEPVINDENENDQTDTDQDRQTDTDRTDGEDSVTTPSQSRSPSVHPVDDDSVDAFDGYSFKGRHSIIMDDEEEEAEDEAEDEDEEEEAEEVESSIGASTDNLGEDESSEAASVSVEATEGLATVEEGAEPKTPEARPTALPEEAPPATADEPEPVEEPAAPISQDATPPAPTEPAVPPAPQPAPQPETKPQTKPVPRVQPRYPPATRQRRREKSGITALDRDLDEEGAQTEREEEDDWDLVEANVDEERNGAKGTSLFARGVVDRYKLAVFRKSTPRRSSAARNFAAMSLDTDVPPSEPSDSPTPSEKHRRGRTPLTFRKHPRQFLRQKSPPPSLSRSNTATKKSLTHSASANLSASTTSSGLLSSSQSQSSTLPMSPSLKSKESAISMGSPSESSDQSLNGDGNDRNDTVKGPSVISGGDEEKQRNKVLKKYKEGAEKVLSIFQSPKQ